MILTNGGIYVARDKVGRTPVIIGQKDDGYCATFESSAFLIWDIITIVIQDLEKLTLLPQNVEVIKKPGEEMHICSFLWVYYGYPTSTYEGVNVECMRNRCGDLLANMI